MAHYKELNEYRRFSRPKELHKAVLTLRGIVSGIAADNVINNAEIQELMNWCLLHEHLEKKHPFNELLPVIQNAYSDGVITSEEAEDIVWLCDKLTAKDPKNYDLRTSALQYLHGILHGLMSDGILNDEEIYKLQRWISENSYLSGSYPFDEIESLLLSVTMDGIITDDERNILKAFFGEFIDTTVSYNITESDLAKFKEEYSIEGICSVCQEIDFKDSLFSFTGRSDRAKRDDIAKIIEELGGTFKNTVSQGTNYLVVGISGNPCWAYSCYGRKIEQAMKLRKQGYKLRIVSEVDFWDIIEDL